ncbi:MAG: hypothetical protein KAT90_00490 [Gammaproteobacteria bacterium]|nr:hypothetical protein [Gammaproteobacteria bacterium]
MIVLRSDYSPSAAQEEQEQDNYEMLAMVLYEAGLKGCEIERYMKATSEAAVLYTEALNLLPEGESTSEAYERAKSVTIKPLNEAHCVLVNVGATIENKIHEPQSEGYYPTIVTTVFKGFDQMQPVARIERPVLDIESETYENNRTGFGA